MAAKKKQMVKCSGATRKCRKRGGVVCLHGRQHELVHEDPGHCSSWFFCDEVKKNVRCVRVK